MNIIVYNIYIYILYTIAHKLLSGPLVLIAARGLRMIIA